MNTSLRVPEMYDGQPRAVVPLHPAGYLLGTMQFAPLPDGQLALIVAGGQCVTLNKEAVQWVVRYYVATDMSGGCIVNKCERKRKPWCALCEVHQP